MKVNEEIVTLFSDEAGPKAIEISNGHTQVFTLKKMNREDRFRLLQELAKEKDGEKS